MIAVNLTQNEIVAARVKEAKGFFQRMKGLLGTSHLDPDDGLWIPKCQGVHSFGMAYTIDVVFLDQNFKVIHCLEKMEPNRASPVLMNAAGVLEFPGGWIKEKNVRLGDQLCFR